MQRSRRRTISFVNVAERAVEECEKGEAIAEIGVDELKGPAFDVRHGEHSTDASDASCDRRLPGKVLVEEADSALGALDKELLERVFKERLDACALEVLDARKTFKRGRLRQQK